MTRIQILLLVGAALLAAPLLAAPVVVVTAVQGAEPRPVEVRMRAVRVSGSGTPIERVFTAPGNESIELPEGNWEVSLRSPAHWSAPVAVTAGERVTIDLWPAGTLRGTLKSGQKPHEVEALRVHFTSALSDQAAGVVTGDAPCSIEEDRWNCSVPAGRYDLRLIARGYAAEFRWDQSVVAGKETNLGALVLRPGASLMGFVTAGRGIEAAMKDVAVKVEPRAFSPEGDRRSYTATVNARGFFQVTGIPSGEYVIHAATRGLRSEERPVTILENRSAELRAPLVLERPKRMFVSITPPQGPWQIRLYRVAFDTSRLNDPVSGLTDDTGRWSTEVVTGQYLLKVGLGESSTWRSTDVTVASSDVAVDLTIATRRVSGTVRLGDVPLADARLIFGGRYGPEQETLVTDDKGRFAGDLPGGDAVAEEPAKWTITIDADAPRVRRTLERSADRNDAGDLELDIVLPRTSVTGRVLNEDGSAEPQAIVTLRSPDGSLEQSLANPDGSFDFFGFEPGTYRVSAAAFQRTSESRDVVATEAPGAGVEIVLRRDVVVRGKVQSRSTLGVDARLTALQRGVQSEFVPTTVTGAGGQFELILPPGTRVFDLILQAPGFALAAGRVAVEPKMFLTLTVDQKGGGLSLELPAAGDAVLRHEGAEFPLRWLVTMAGGSIERRDGSDVATIPNVEAGEYTLCGGGTCRTGLVTPHGLLRLSVGSEDQR
jgi:hypothetical protein